MVLLQLADNPTRRVFTTVKPLGIHTARRPCDEVANATGHVLGLVLGALASSSPQRSVDSLEVGVDCVGRWHHLFVGLEANRCLFLRRIWHAHNERPVETIEPATVNTAMCLELLGIPRMVEAATTYVLRAVPLSE